MKRAHREALRVCFDEEPPQIMLTRRTSYKDPSNKNTRQPQARDDDGNPTWYTSHEIGQFKRQNEQLRHALGRLDAKSYHNRTSWAYAVRRLHGACCKTTSFAHVIDMLRTVQYPFSETTLGLERQGIPCIAAACQARRADIYAGILEWQYAAAISEDVRAERIRVASTTVSHASILYARVLAEIVAATLSEEECVDVSLSTCTSNHEKSATCTPCSRGGAATFSKPPTPVVNPEIPTIKAHIWYRRASLAFPK